MHRTKQKSALLGLATALLAGSPATAQLPSIAPAPVSAPSLAVAPDVAAAYDTYHVQPIWFRAGPDSPAIAQLVAILQRAPFDGFAAGPQLAAQVQAASAGVRANPATAAAAERIVSTAWVRYVQSLKRPTDGMIYAYP